MMGSKFYQMGGLNAAQLLMAKRRESMTLFALTLPAIVVVFFVIVIPVGWLFSLSFLDSSGQLSWINYQKMLEYKSYARVLRRLLM